MLYPRRSYREPVIFKLALIILFIFAGPSFSIGPNLWKLENNIYPSVLSSRSSGNIHIEKVNYISSFYKGKPVKIFGYFCYPKTLVKKGMPGVVIVHGGAGRADLNRAMHWAKRGYAALSIDLPGKGEKRAGSRSTGPDMDVSVLLRVKPDLTYNYLYHAVRAARCGITFLENKPFVNQGIAMVGLSWGGVITLLSNGTDSRLSAAVPVFGSGFLNYGSTWQEWFDSKMTKDDLKTYIENFDARQYLTTQHAPLYYITGTNDHCFYLPNFIWSYEMITQECTLSFSPNNKHAVTADMMQNIYKWVDYKLKNAPAFPSVSISSAIKKDDFALVSINAGSQKPIKTVSVFYTRSGLSEWTEKTWHEIKAKKSGDSYIAKIPMKFIRPEILFYSSTRDIGGRQTSTPVYSLFNLLVNDGRNIIVRSEPIDQIYERKISSATWFNIFGTTPEAAVLPLNALWKKGYSLTKHADSFYLKKIN